VRIALVHPFAWPAVRRGGERYLNDLAWYLRDAGHDVDVITGTASPKARGRRPFRIGPVETFGLRAFPALLRRRYDVAHALTPSAALAARSAGHRTLFTVLGHPERDVFRGRPWQRRLLSAAMRGAHRVATLSRPAAEQVRAVFGLQATVLPPGVRLDAFTPALEPRAGPVRILFASALDQPQKGLDVLVTAFADLRRDYPDARLVLAGPGDPDRALAQTTREAIDVCGPGSPEDLPNRYRTATVTVLPSRHEAFGLVLVESLATGTPVIGATPGGASDIVEPSVGRTVPYGDADALAHALRACIDLARDPAVPSRCREHARRWDWSTSVGPQHEAVYQEIAR
jgi:phosphatidyl-myo-inositol alpha-mannosyltransferase